MTIPAAGWELPLPFFIASKTAQLFTAVPLLFPQAAETEI